MAGWLSKVIKGAMIAGGSILSFIPGMIAVGAPLIVAGLSINPTDGTADKVSNASQTLGNLLSNVNSLQNAQENQAIKTNIMTWIKNNMVIVIAAVGLLMILIFKPFRRK